MSRHATLLDRLHAQKFNAPHTPTPETPEIPNDLLDLLYHPAHEPPALTPTPHVLRMPKEQWLAQAREDATTLTPKITKAWQKDGGPMRGNKEIGDLAIANGFVFSPKVAMQNKYKAEYEAYQTTSKWEKEKEVGRQRAKRHRNPELQIEKKPKKSRRTIYPGYTVDFGDKSVTKYAQKQWSNHVAANPNSQGVKDIQELRAWIRDIEWFFHQDLDADDFLMQPPVYQRYRAELNAIRGSDPKLKHQTVYNPWGDPVPWVAPTVQWYADIIKTPPLGQLPARFKAYYEEIRADFHNRSGGRRVEPTPLPPLNQLVPDSSYEADQGLITDDESEWEDTQEY